jgi:hypothetical protein
MIRQTQVWSQISLEPHVLCDRPLLRSKWRLGISHFPYLETAEDMTFEVPKIHGTVHALSTHFHTTRLGTPICFTLCTV